jgi:hypothetical protein
MGSVFKDEDQIHIFMRFSSQGRVVKLLDLLRLNEMNKIEQEGKVHQAKEQLRIPLLNFI